MKTPCKPLVRNIGIAVAAIGATYMTWNHLRGRSGELDRWLAAVRAAPPMLGEKDGEFLLRSLVDALRTPGKKKRILSAPVAAREASARVAIVSVSDGSSAAHVCASGGKSLVDALDGALARLGPLPLKEEIWVRLDVVTSVTKVRSVPAGDRIDLAARSSGVSLDGSSDGILLPETILGAGWAGLRNVRLDKVIERLAKNDPAHPAWKRLKDRGSLGIRTFTTDSYFTDGKSFTMFRDGRRILDRITAGEILAAAEGGAHYMERPRSARPKKARRSARDVYDPARHSESIRALMDLAAVDGDSSRLETVRQDIEALLTRVKPHPKNSKILCVVTGGKVWLKNVAQAVLALARYQEVTGDHRYQERLLGLGRYIGSTLRKDGRFHPRLRSFATGKAETSSSGVESGEALLALVKLQKATGNPLWLRAATRAADFLAGAGKTGRHPKLAPGESLMYALEELHALVPKREYMDAVLEVSRGVIASQYRDGSHPELPGTVPGKKATAAPVSPTPALVHAYDLAVSGGLDDLKGEILQGVRLSLGQVLKTQVGPEKAMFFNHPRQVLGAFATDLARPGMRNDHPSGSLTALLDVLRLLKRQGWDSLDMKSAPMISNLPAAGLTGLVSGT